MAGVGIVYYFNKSKEKNINSILFIGDSNTVANYSYADKLRQSFPNLKVKKIAKVGEKTDWALNELQKELSKNKYDIVAVLIGSNDIYALNSNTTGYENIALGISALGRNAIGNNNVAIGREALLSNTTGNYNVALGQSALFSNTTGNNNVALGPSALSNNTTGSFNSGLGYRVQSGNYSGSVILGAEAAATANGQFALGSSYHPIGPVATETLVSNKTLEINLNGNLYKVLMYQA